ncbi:MAG: hypothetical protein J6P28_01000 [Treponema sp.]|nr:hypothetical protein [Treponema sp.]
MIRDKYPEYAPKVFSYEESIVVFLDILGFKNKVIESLTSSKAIKQIAELLEYIEAFNTTNGVNEFISTKNIIDLPNLELTESDIKQITNQIQILQFSDSLVITLPYTACDFIKKISLITYNLAYLIGKLAMSNFFIRGGIAIGKIYHKGNIIFGPALLKAYELESKYAVYPRVILSEELDAKLQKFGAINSVPFIKRNRGDWLYVDFIVFAKAIQNSSVCITLIMENVKNNIAECDEKIEATKRIKEKYEWLLQKIEELEA